MTYNGYYTTLIRPGLRLISIHTGYVQPGNFYLTWNHDPTRDMASQLSWFKSTLESARALNENVFIQQHYPLDSIENSLQQPWYDTYKEYSDIIKVIFAGHSHSDQYHVFGSFPNNNTNHKNNKNNNQSNPFAVEFIAGSVTTYQGRNPAFRVYSYDRESCDLIDYVQYRFDLEKSNSLKKPIWFPAYSMKSEYGLTGISAKDLKKLAENMAINDQLFQKYEYNYNNGYPNSGMDRNSTICTMMSATSQDYNYCIKNIYTSAISLKEYYKKYNKMDVDVN